MPYTRSICWRSKWFYEPRNFIVTASPFFTKHHIVWSFLLKIQYTIYLVSFWLVVTCFTIGTLSFIGISSQHHACKSISVSTVEVSAFLFALYCLKYYYLRFRLVHRLVHSVVLMCSIPLGHLHRISFWMVDLHCYGAKSQEVMSHHRFYFKYL